MPSSLKSRKEVWLMWLDISEQVTVHQSHSLILDGQQKTKSGTFGFLYGFNEDGDTGSPIIPSSDSQPKIRKPFM